MNDAIAEPIPRVGEPAAGSHRVLYVSTRKWVGVLAIGSAFAVIGLAMIFIKGDFLAWFITLCFGLVAAVAALQLTGAGSHLELNADTFTITNFGRSTTERWDECSDFKVYRLTRTEQVVYDRARDVETHAGEMNRSISGRSKGLPDTFNMTAHDLAKLMAAYQQHGVDRSWQAHAGTVPEFEAVIADSLREAGVAADIITDRDAMDLPDGMTSWPSIIAVARAPKADGSRHVLICADVPSPSSRWITEHTQRKQTFDLLEADELHIIDADTKDIRRILRDDT